MVGASSAPYPVLYADHTSLLSSTVVNENLQELRSALEDHLTGTRVFKPSEEIINVLNEDIDALESIYQVSDTDLKATSVDGSDFRCLVAAVWSFSESNSG